MKKEKLICNLTDVTYDKGYIALWIETGNLPETFEYQGREFLKKTSLHASLVCVKNFLRTEPAAEAKILEAFCNFTKTNNILFAGCTGELRLVKDEERGRESIVAMCDISCLNAFNEVLSDMFGRTVSKYPTHLTLYTLGKDMGIGVHSFDQLQSQSEVVEIPELSEIINGIT